MTSAAGVLAVGELMDRHGVVEALDAGIGAIKSRARGIRGVELVASLAQCQLLDATDVEVYGRHKRGVAYNYLCQRYGPRHLATWAGAGLTMAAGLLTGVQDARPQQRPAHPGDGRSTR